MNIKEIVTFIESERAVRGFSKKELARKAAISVANYYQILNGKSKPAGETIHVLLSELGFELAVIPKMRGKK